MDEPMRRLFLPAALLLSAPAALAQTPAPADALANGVACTVPAATTGLNANVQAAIQGGQGTSDAMSQRLNQISSDGSVCQAVRDAAKDLASAYAPPSEAAELDEPAKASSAIFADAMAEARRRAANLKFELGPPPRHLTKGRNSGT